MERANFRIKIDWIGNMIHNLRYRYHEDEEEKYLKKDQKMQHFAWQNFNGGIVCYVISLNETSKSIQKKFAKEVRAHYKSNWKPVYEELNRSMMNLHELNLERQDVEYEENLTRPILTDISKLLHAVRVVG